MDQEGSPWPLAQYARVVVVVSSRRQLGLRNALHVVLGRTRLVACLLVSLALPTIIPSARHLHVSRAAQESIR